MSLKDDVLAYVRTHPNLTATQISKDLGRKVGSVSGVLHELAQAKEVEWGDGSGPRGGMVYRIPPAKLAPTSNKTSWSHLLDDDEGL